MKRVDNDNIAQLTFVMKGLYSSSRLKMLRHLLHNYYPADISLALKDSSPEEVLSILRVADQKNQVRIFQYLSLELELQLIPLLKSFEIRFYFENLPADDRTNLLREMDEHLRENVLKDLSKQERDFVDTLLSYDEDFSGSMVTEGLTVYASSTIQDTLIAMRQQAGKIEHLHTICVLDAEDVLIGSVCVEHLIFSEPQEIVENVMSPDPIFIYAEQPKEEAVETIQKYDVAVLPVVDQSRKFLGIITYDDAMDLVLEEGFKNLYRFSGISAKDMSEKPYLEESILVQVKRRFTWTIIPIAMEIVTGHLIENVETMLQSIFIIATFIPMIAAAGGNIGSQSASLITRAIALKEISFSNTFKVLMREFQVAFLIAVICCPVLIFKMLVFPHPPTTCPFGLIMLAVTLALGAQLIVSALLGALMPMVAIKLRMDPAIMSAPVLASSVDILGLLMYFTIVKLLIL